MVNPGWIVDSVDIQGAGYSGGREGGVSTLSTIHPGGLYIPEMWRTPGGWGGRYPPSNIHILEVFIRENQDALPLFEKLSSPGPEFPTAYAPDVLRYQCLYLDPITLKINRTRLWDCLYGDPAMLKMHADRSMWFIGPAGFGKDELCRGIARNFCERYEKLSYVITQSLDPLGVMTKSGAIGKAGAFVFTDFTLKTKLDDRLSVAEQKAFLYTKQRAHYNCRYSEAVLPAFVPRLMAVNSGARQDGSINYADWFDREGLSGPAMLANDDEASFRTADTHQVALARRVLIIKVDRPCFVPATVASIDEELELLAQGGLARVAFVPRP